MSETAEPRVIRCPRCGYDVSALPPTWQTQCPLQSVCSECGLEFAWADLYNPRRTERPWFVEDERIGSRWRLCRAGVRTALRALRPWRFWREVRMEQQPNALRLAGFAPSWVVGVYTLGTLMFLLQVIVFRSMFGGNFSTANSYDVLTWPKFYATSPVTGALLVFHVVPPLLLFLLTDTLALARVRLAHVGRAGIYALVLPGMLMVLMNATTLVISLLWWLFLSRRMNFTWMVWLNQNFSWPFAVVAFLWVPLWWGLVTRRYMRMERWWVIWLVIVGVGLLAGFVAGVLLRMWHLQGASP